MLNSFQIALMLELPKIGKSKVQKISKDFFTLNTNISENELFGYLKDKGYLHGEQKSIYENKVEEIKKLFEIYYKQNISAITYLDENYPYLFKQLPDKPIIIYVKGNINCANSQPTCAVIGTREPTGTGLIYGKGIGARLAENNITVVSGLAKGCDTAGHLGCISKGGKTIAVLAQGLERIYPAENKKLAADIVENGGCLISEYSYHTTAKPYYFIERDRLQSGLSLATIVVQTDIKGGTMYTANFTLEQKRRLYAFEYETEHRAEKTRGNEKMIADGMAVKLKGSEDVKELIAWLLDNYKEQARHRGQRNEDCTEKIKTSGTKSNSENQASRYLMPEERIISGEINPDYKVSHDLNYEYEGIKLSASQLAERLNVEIEWIRKEKNKKTFSKKTEGRDPDNYWWIYNKETGIFEGKKSKQDKIF